MIQTKELVKDVLRYFARFGDLTSRSMFGGYGICVNNVMFALVSNNRFYLRGNESLRAFFLSYHMEQFIYRNRGAPVLMHYYLVNEQQWNSDDKLFELVDIAIKAAQQDKHAKESRRHARLKELANLNISIERLLIKAGITSKEQLFSMGAVKAYLVVKQSGSSTSIELLFLLAGAIKGCHVAALPEGERQVLLDELASHSISGKTNC